MSGSLYVTNLSAKTRQLSGGIRSLTRTVHSETGVINFDGSALPTVVNAFGSDRAYTHRSITVGPDVDRLSASVASPDPTYVVFLVLVDPDGVYQAYSLPQGSAAFARVDARKPKPGVWKLYVLANPGLTTAIHYRATLSAFTRLGTVRPAASAIRAGESLRLKVRIPLPANPGDTAASLQLRTLAGARTGVPLSLRGVITPAGRRTSTFTGYVTGGNGRGEPAQTNTYYIDVPAGRPLLSAGVHLDGQVSPYEILQGYLVSPDGEPLGAQSNTYVSARGNLHTVAGLQLFARTPMAGRWTLIVEATNPVSGENTRQPFTGSVSLVGLPVVTDVPLPNSTRAVLPAGTAVRIRVKVTNTAVVTRSFFADGRLTRNGSYRLASQNPGDDQQDKDLLDLSYAAQWLVPSRTSSMTVRAAANQPIQLDAGWNYGDPTLAGVPSANSSMATFAGSKLAPGPWYAQAGPIGPFTSAPPTPGTVDYGATVRTNVFDPTVTTSTGDYWAGALVPAPADAGRASLDRAYPLARRPSGRFAPSASTTAGAPTVTGPLTLQPGDSGTIIVQIRPRTVDRGTTVRGTIDVDTFDAYLGTGDEVRALHYAYRVG